MGSPFDTGTWDGVIGAYYTGYGSGEMMWLLVAIAFCVVASLGWPPSRVRVIRQERWLSQPFIEMQRPPSGGLFCFPG